MPDTASEQVPESRRKPAPARSVLVRSRIPWAGLMLLGGLLGIAFSAVAADQSAAPAPSAADQAELARLDRENAALRERLRVLEGQHALAQKLDTQATRLATLAERLEQRLGEVEGDGTEPLPTEAQARAGKLEARVAELQAHLKQQQLAAEEALLRADKAEKLHAALEESNARLRTENERLSMELATARERQAEAMQRVLELDTRLEATAARAGVAAPVSDGPPAAAGASPQPAVASATKVVYEVREEDTLSRIAAKVYGDASAWGRIFDANRDVLDGPDDLALGMRLIIP
jgi:nucleoid-associated protein YgaU